MILIRRHVVSSVSVLVVMAVSCGCPSRGLLAPPTPQEGFVGRWEPEWNFPLEKRPLPPSQRVMDDLAAWRNEDDQNTWKVRCYEGRLANQAYQSNFEVSVRLATTPLGKVRRTYASFIYEDPTRGRYLMTWQLLGSHDPEFLRLTGRPRAFLLNPIGYDTSASAPVFQVVGVEGCGPNSIAVSGKPGTRVR